MSDRRQIKEHYDGTQTHRNIDAHFHVPLHFEVIGFGLKVDGVANPGDAEVLAGGANTVDLEATGQDVEDQM